MPDILSQSPAYIRHYYGWIMQRKIRAYKRETYKRPRHESLREMLRDKRDWLKMTRGGY